MVELRDLLRSQHLQVDAIALPAHRHHRAPAGSVGAKARGDPIRRRAEIGEQAGGAGIVQGRSEAGERRIVRDPPHSDPGVLRFEDHRAIGDPAPDGNDLLRTDELSAFHRHRKRTVTLIPGRRSRTRGGSRPPPPAASTTAATGPGTASPRRMETAGRSGSATRAVAGWRGSWANLRPPAGAGR